MSTANTTLSESVRQLIEQRLEVIDQSLAGLLPRQERLAAVAHLEARICNLAGNATAVASQSAISSVGSNATPPAAVVPYRVDVPAFGTLGTNWQAGPPAKKSRLAIASGLLGVGSIVLMLGLPITYALIVMVGELVGEIASISILGVHTVAVGMAGMAAIGLSLVALLILRRRRGSLTGHGWAITGLCTGPLPILAGAAAGLLLLLELGIGMSSVTVSQPAVTSADDGSEVHATPRPPEFNASYMPAPVSGFAVPPYNLPQCMPMPAGSPVYDDLPPTAARPSVRSVGHAMPASTLQPVEDDCPYGPGPVPPSAAPTPIAKPATTPAGNPPEANKAATAPTEPAPSEKTYAPPANPQPTTEVPTPVEAVPTSEPVLGTSDLAPLGI